ncbi:MAG: MGMT family protein [Thermomicrobiales bacterium]
MGASVEFARRVYAVVALVPLGRVTTYGHVAAYLGERRSARMVGWALNSVPNDLDIPCHRVVNRVGILSGRWHFPHPDHMRMMLEEEAVPFIDEDQVDLKQCLWDPAQALYVDEQKITVLDNDQPPPTK